MEGTRGHTPELSSPSTSSKLVSTSTSTSELVSNLNQPDTNHDNLNDVTIKVGSGLAQSGHTDGQSITVKSKNTDARVANRRCGNACTRVSNLVCRAFGSLIRTPIIVGASAIAGLATNIAFRRMLDNSSHPVTILTSAAAAGLTGAIVVPRVASLITPLIRPTCGETIAKKVSFALAAMPLAAIATMTIMVKPLWLKLDVITAGIIGRGVNNFLRDLNTNFTYGLIPRHTLVNKYGKPEPANRDPQKSFNKLRTILNVFLYVGLTYLFLLHSKATPLLNILGTDGEDKNNGNLKDFLPLFIANFSPEIVRTIVETIDDILFSATAEVTAHYQGLSLEHTKASWSTFLENFTKESRENKFNDVLDAATARNFMGLITTSVKLALEAGGVGPNNPISRLIQSIPAGLSETRAYFVNASKVEDREHKRGRGDIHLPPMDANGVHSPENNFIEEQPSVLDDGHSFIEIPVEKILDKEEKLSPSKVADSFKKLMSTPEKINNSNSDNKTTLHLNSGQPNSTKKNNAENKDQTKLNSKEIIQTNFGAMEQNTAFSINDQFYRFISHDSNTGIVTARIDTQRSPADASPIKISAIRDLVNYLVIDNSST
jgi:hypothetical protein